MQDFPEKCFDAGLFVIVVQDMHDQEVLGGVK
jgi:hypothetical protein